MCAWTFPYPVDLLTRFPAMPRRKDKTETGFHSLKGELAAQSAAWDLDSAREAAAREVGVSVLGGSGSATGKG